MILLTGICVAALVVAIACFCKYLEGPHEWFGTVQKRARNAPAWYVGSKGQARARFYLQNQKDQTLTTVCQQGKKIHCQIWTGNQPAHKKPLCRYGLTIDKNARKGAYFRWIKKKKLPFGAYNFMHSTRCLKR